MTNDPGSLSEQRRARIESYYRYVDDGDPRLSSLFTEDFELWFPKFGADRGHAALARLAERLALTSLTHDIDGLRYIVSGDTIVVEGTEHGVTGDGTAWPDGDVSQGRFCSVFDFRDLLIARMSIYVDPDFTSEDSARVDALHGSSPG